METSAKANVNIDKAFCDLAEAILDKTSGRDTTESTDKVVMNHKDQSRQQSYKGCCA